MPLQDLRPAQVRAESRADMLSCVGEAALVIRTGLVLNSASNVDPKPTMLNQQPGAKERRQSCSALRTSAIDLPLHRAQRSTEEDHLPARRRRVAEGRRRMPPQPLPLSVVFPLNPPLAARRALRPSTDSTKSRSRAASLCDRLTVALLPSTPRRTLDATSIQSTFQWLRSS